MRTLNRYRSLRFHRALRSYGTSDALDECLTDLLADARHWCDQNRHDFAALDRSAYSAYCEEVTTARRRDA